MMWKYLSYGTQQTVKLPSFEVLTHICDPAKAEQKKESAEKTGNIGLNTMELYKAKKYKELIKLLLIDEYAVKEFNEGLAKLGIKINKYPNFMTREEKLEEMQRITLNSSERKKEEVKEELSNLSEVKKEEPIVDPNDMEPE